MKKMVLATVLASLFLVVLLCQKIKQPSLYLRLKKSAEEGNAASQYQLGVKYEGGEGVEQNTQKSIGVVHKSG